MYGITREIAEQYGIPAYEPAVITADTKTTRYCHPCSVSWTALAADGCWFCGGPTTLDKPPYWPPRQCSVNVTAGQSFDPREEEHDRN